MLRIIGAEGSVAFPSLTVWSGAKDWSEAPTARSEATGETKALQAQLMHFCEVIAGRTAPLVDVADGRATLAATLEVEAAIAGTL